MHEPEILMYLILRTQLDSICKKKKNLGTQQSREQVSPIHGPLKLWPGRRKVGGDQVHKLILVSTYFFNRKIK